LTDIGTAILGGISTLVGAQFAFRLTERKDQEIDLAKRIHALNKANFTVGRQLNGIQYIREEVLPCDTPEKRLFECRAAMPPDYSDLRVDFESLSILLDSPDPDLLLRLSVAQDGFHQTMRAITLRAQYFVDQFQPAVMASGILSGPFTLEDARKEIGELVFNSALNYTNGMFVALEETALRLQKVIDELEALSRHIYPGEKFMRFRLKKEEMHDAVKNYRL
jgi:hypothetical protein